MDIEDIAKNTLKFLLKLIWKLFLILVWGVLRIVEVIIHHINTYLQKLIK